MVTIGIRCITHPVLAEMEGEQTDTDGIRGGIGRSLVVASSTGRIAMYYRYSSKRSWHSAHVGGIVTYCMYGTRRTMELHLKLCILRSAFLRFRIVYWSDDALATLRIFALTLTVSISVNANVLRFVHENANTGNKHLRYAHTTFSVEVAGGRMLLEVRCCWGVADIDNRLKSTTSASTSDQLEQRTVPFITPIIPPLVRNSLVH